MKQRILLLFALCALVLQSCKQDIEYAQPIDLVYQLEVDPNAVIFAVPYEKANIVLVNKTNNEKYSAVVSHDGQVSFKGVSPGTYSINVSLAMTADEVTQLSGVASDEDLNFNFSGDNLTYFDNNIANLRLVNSRPLGNFVFKQVYYAGSNTSNGAGIRDFFVEIYNNSNEVLYADSLCFAIVYGKNNNNAGSYLLPNLQYDWAQSLDMSTIGNANTDYFYAKAIFMIPSNGTGNRYPIQPGESFIIAESALDHTKPYTLNSDKEQTIKDATLTVDLSKADFEVYLYPYEQKIQPGRNKNASDVDNPEVTDVETLFATGMRDMILNPQGKESYIIFKVDGTDDPNLFAKYANPTDRTITDKTTLYPQVPNKYVLDAVEISSVIEKDKTPRRLPLEFDAGNASIPGGPYSSQSIVRKTKQVANGRRVLMDTNNSTQDFGSLIKADPTKSNTSFID